MFERHANEEAEAPRYVILSERSESKDLCMIVTFKGQIGAAVPHPTSLRWATFPRGEGLGAAAPVRGMIFFQKTIHMIFCLWEILAVKRRWVNGEVLL